MLKKARFQSKLIFYNVIITLLIMCSIIGIFYKYVVTAITDRSVQDFETIISKTSTQFENLLYNMDKSALLIAANPSIVRYFMNVDKKPDTNYFIKEPLISSLVVQLLNSYNFKKDAFARICLYNNYKDFVCTATTMTTRSAIEDFFQSDSFAKTKKHFKYNNNYSLYRPPTKDILNDSSLPSSNYFSIVREIKDYSSNSLKCGYVEVQESVEKINDILKDIGSDSNAVILDKDMNIVYKSQGLTQDQTTQEIQRLLTSFKSKPLKNESYYSNKKYISYKLLDNTPYSLLFIKENDNALKPLWQFNILLILGSILVLAFALLTEMLIVKRLSKPLIELNDSIKQVNIDNLQVDIANESGNDELQQLNIAFNTMLNHLKHAMELQLIAKTNELKSHLFALQSQMSPHFMYNILAIISMEAGQAGNLKTQNICSKLCKMLSFTTSMNDGFCTLEEEVKNADNYMALMKERYEELFEYSIHQEENTENICIPKLIVQPLCENSFKHAFKNMEPVWRIKLTAYTKDDKWYIEIQDNGMGFPQDYLLEYEKMCQEITFDNVKEKLNNISIGGLCIANIYMRLKISYGNEFTLRLYNKEHSAIVLLGGLKYDKSINS